MTMKTFLAGVVAMLIAGSAAAQEKSVAIAADPWCPHTCSAKDVRPGYMIEVARQAFTDRGWRVTYKTAAWSRVMHDVKAGKIDGAVGALRGESAGMTLHAEPLGRQSNVFVVRADDPWTLQGLVSVKGRVVGSIKDYSYSEEIDDWLAGGHTQVQALGGENALGRNLQKLLSGRVDVVVEDEAVLLHTIKAGGLADKVRVAGRMPGGDLFIAFTSAEHRGARMAEVLDQGIRDMRSSGQLRRILDGYGLKDWKE
jgi:polar amino acid transport system substrate-binding protein